MYDIFESLLKENGITAYKVAKDTGVISSMCSSFLRLPGYYRQVSLSVIILYTNVSIMSSDSDVLFD